MQRRFTSALLSVWQNDATGRLGRGAKPPAGQMLVSAHQFPSVLAFLEIGNSNKKGELPLETIQKRSANFRTVGIGVDSCLGCFFGITPEDHV